jgi:tetratricopeptide (TPR) repeat protein
MNESLYERYKDALRRGHVALMGGRLEAALAAYAEAAAIAPERGLPHAGIGAVELRLGRPEDALAAFGAALERSPGDEAALAGRADALVALGRRVEAAEALGVLAEVLDRSNRLPEALDAARHALELAESKSRRRSVEMLADRVRQSPGDQAAEQALANALRILGRGEVAVAGGAADVEAEDAPAAPEVVAPEATPGQPAPEAAELMLAAEAALDTGAGAEARDPLLAAARAHAAAGRRNAALDACYLALAVAPADPELHLALVEIYLAGGWVTPAVDKLLLLDRLVALTGERAARERLAAFVEEHLPDEPRLAALRA